jgi:hypothetical protein
LEDICKNPTAQPSLLKEITMENSHSDAFVFFGATATRRTRTSSLPQATVKRGHLDVPAIGVAKEGWTLEQLKPPALDSLQKHGGVDAAAFQKLSSLLRYADGDYQYLETELLAAPYQLRCVNAIGMTLTRPNERLVGQPEEMIANTRPDAQEMMHTDECWVTPWPVTLLCSRAKTM